MAADNARRLISRIVRERHIDTVLLRGVAPDWFNIPEDRQVFDFLTEHYRTYGEVPTGVTVKDNYPSYRLLKVDDSLEYLVDQFLDHRRAVATQNMLNEAVGLWDGNGPRDYERVLSVLRESLRELDEVSATVSELDLVVEPDGRFHEYLVRKERDGELLGYATGFPTIDRATAGLQPGQLVTILASPKAGKSTLALKMASVIHQNGSPIVFQSFEMSNLEQQERFDALRAGVSHNRLRRGALSESEEDAYQRMLGSLGDVPFVLADSASGITVSALAAKVSSRVPDVLFVDGVYLMIDEVTGEANTPQALTNITRSFKRLAQRLNIPIVITTQALLWKMQGTRLSEKSPGYSSSFLQDSDVVLGLERIENEDTTRTLRVIASRNCGPADVTCVWDWNAGVFEEIEGGFEEPEDDDEAFAYEGVA